MGDEMIVYLQQLEILAFFSGYPLVYAIVGSLKSTTKTKSSIGNVMFMLLPFGYAICGILFIGLQLKNFYPDYTFKHLSSEVRIPFYTIWGLTTLVFLLPVARKMPVISLLHSLVFFFLLAKSFYLQITSPLPDTNAMKNYMKIYIDSIILNTVLLVCLSIFYYIIRRIKKKTSGSN